jgi:hypothetical protein
MSSGASSRFCNIEYLNKRFPRHDTSHLTPSRGNMDRYELSKPILFQLTPATSRNGCKPSFTPITCKCRSRPCKCKVIVNQCPLFWCLLQAERQKEGQEPQQQTGYKAIVSQNHSNGTTAPSRKSSPALFARLR